MPISIWVIAIILLVQLLGVLPQSWNQEKYFTAAANIFVKPII